MKIWGIIATILMVGFLGVSVWLYSQNTNLKSDLSTAKIAKETAEKKISTANKKADVLALFFNQSQDQASMLKAKDMIAGINDPTLSADWKAMEQNGNSSSGTKMFQDLIKAIQSDLK